VLIELEEERELGIVAVEARLKLERVGRLIVPMVDVEVTEFAARLEMEDGTGRVEMREAIWVGDEPDIPSRRKKGE